MTQTATTDSAHYQATLWLTGILTMHEDTDDLTLTLPNGETHTLWVFRYRRKKLTEEHLNRLIKVRTWPTRDTNGTLQRAALVTWRRTEDGNTNHLRVTGRLIYIDREARIARVLIRPNLGGSLARRFTIGVRLTGQALRDTPNPLGKEVQPDAGVRFNGSLQNGELVADTFEPVTLGPTKAKVKRKKPPVTSMENPEVTATPASAPAAKRVRVRAPG